jgi:hypothetical protein
MLARVVCILAWLIPVAVGETAKQQINCIEGTFIAVRTDNDHYTTECIACPTGYYQTQRNQAKCNFGTKPPAGNQPPDQRSPPRLNFNGKLSLRFAK